MIRHETGPTVVMNCATYSNNTHSYLVAGQESHCQLYNVKSVLEEVDQKVEEISDHNNVRRRKDSYNKQQDKLAGDKNKNTKKLTFVLAASDSIQTDFCDDDDEPVQRVVRISKDGKFMATGMFIF